MLIMLVNLCLWSHAQMAIAIMVAALFKKKENVASMVSYGAVVLLCATGIVLPLFVDAEATLSANLAFTWFPPMTFSYITVILDRG